MVGVNARTQASLIFARAALFPFVIVTVHKDILVVRTYVQSVDPHRIFFVVRILARPQ